MTTTAPQYFIIKCSWNGHITRYTDSERLAVAARYEDGSLSGTSKYGQTRCHCGSANGFKAIRVRVTDTECSDKCTAAQGPSCDCHCGGANHAIAGAR